MGNNVARTPREQRREGAENATTEKPDSNVSKEGERLKEGIDAVLDEIDELLAEEDAEEFVENYVQRGGE